MEAKSNVGVSPNDLFPRPVISKPHPSKGDYNTDPTIKALQRRGFINQGLHSKALNRDPNDPLAVVCDPEIVEPAVLVKFIQSMTDDVFVQEDLFRVLVAPTILETGQTDPALCAYLRASLRNMYYQVDPDSAILWPSYAGTVPGAPLADVLFQLAMIRFHKRVRDERLL